MNRQPNDVYARGPQLVLDVVQDQINSILVN